MEENWTQERLQQQFIDAQAEESTTLEYKAADALGKSDARKKKEVTKDVSAMANSAGGMIIYGISEYQEQDKRHLAEALDPIDRTQFSKEWIEQVINGIQPRIPNLRIHPVPVTLEVGQSDVVYVVDIPQSTTAHQAADYRYYRRYNFECLPMLDHEVRDVMNRGVRPDASVRFEYRKKRGEPMLHEYRLRPLVTNCGPRVIRDFKLEITFLDLDGWPRAVTPIGWGSQPETSQDVPPLLEIAGKAAGGGSASVIVEEGIPWRRVVYRSAAVLFPDDTADLEEAVGLVYRVNDDIYHSMQGHRPPPLLKWTLYADDMPRKQGEKPFRDLGDY
jgi:hypothetical protein